MQTYIEIKNKKVPALGFGTFRMQGDDCLKGTAEALSIGYRHIDTAQAYANEEEVGRAIKNSGVNRDEIFLVTKVTPRNFSKNNFLPSVEESLKKLQTERIDLLLLHWPSDDETNKAAIAQLAMAQQKNYTKLVGISNFTLSQMETARKEADIFCNQVEYHPYLTQNKIRSYLEQHNMLLTAYRPLADGKILNDSEVISLSEKYSRTPAQIILRWFIQQNGVSVIPKASDANHRKENFAIFDFELAREDMDKIFGLNKNERLVNPSWSPKWDD
ncbi:MAG: aldo/keto reductase [Ignavibacteria bacterium]|nr:aldo/keto reductase [Ignavibacteria bacterium]